MTDLEHILRHQRPMIFLDEVLDNGHDHLVAGVKIRQGIPFFEPQTGVPAWVGLEYMAQSIAALAGIRARKAGKPLPLGLIIGCRNYTSTTNRFAPGNDLRISIKELVAEDGGFGSFDCKIENPELVIQARVSVFGGDRQAVA